MFRRAHKHRALRSAIYIAGTCAASCMRLYACHGTTKSEAPGGLYVHPLLRVQAGVQGRGDVCGSGQVVLWGPTDDAANRTRPSGECLQLEL